MINFNLKAVIMGVQARYNGFKLNGTNQLQVHTGDVNLLGAAGFL
jgi:hypothetical protein